MLERRRQLALWTRSAFWFCSLCVALVIVQMGEEQERDDVRFELDQDDGIFNSSFANELDSGPVSPDVLREAVVMIESGLKAFESRSNQDWNATNSRFKRKA